MIVIDENDSVVELAQFLSGTSAWMSPARQVRSLPDRRDADAASAEQNCRGQGTLEDIRTIRKVCQGDAEGIAVRPGPDSRPNPTLSAIRHFEHEFTERLLPVATTKA